VGGGLFNGGRLTLSRCTIAGNSLGNQLGGGIFNAGTLIVRASTVKANHAGRPGGPGQGGGIHNSLAGDLTLEDSLVLGNSADSLGSGGGLYNVGTLTLNRSAVTFNEATLGGGIYNEGRLALKSSSGYEVIDRQALEMFRAAANAVPVPPALRGSAFALDLRIRYNLED